MSSALRSGSALETFFIPKTVFCHVNFTCKKSTGQFICQAGVEKNKIFPGVISKSHSAEAYLLTGSGDQINSALTTSAGTSI